MDDEHLAPDDALAIIAGQREVSARTQPSSALLFGVWGAAWLIGYGLMWLTALDDDTPAVWAAAVAIGGGAGAIAFTIWHSIHRSSGIRGRSPREGAMYGWAWALGFLAQGMIVAALAEAGAEPVVVSLAANAMATMVAGLLYLAGGLLWRSTPLYALGAWLLLTGAAGAFAGLPGSYAVMAFAGGGGMLVAALVSRLTGRRTWGDGA
ncbi:hypothetical protein KIN34_04715 [Cellulomonas sp. DKR-3]|uniref:Transporter n=1 Tax=Cellulomonas fulva TaxID=2835530 RepID=A0ABS5TWQ7_9CELL|nr:hypothetical protein [Cellulomonas fulva]MBT0993587.1 hypothetical protein [Cellulomonas fulva]